MMEMLLNRSLPKWPQMVVTGKKLSLEQALEIIRRTDSFFSYQSGNNHAFIKDAQIVLGMPIKKESYDKEFKNRDGSPNYDSYRKYYDQYSEESDNWKERWECIETEYVKNDWISSSFVFGPHGWCNPDGTISYNDNVGKWPSIQEIYDEWTLLAKEFPFLYVGVTLMSGESSEEDTYPVVSMKIENGIVTLVDPKIENVHEKHDIENKVEETMEEKLIKRFSGDNSSENKISFSILKKWYDKVFLSYNLEKYSKGL